MKEILVDTNIFLRYLLRDDERLYGKAKRVVSKISLGEIKGVVSVLVVNEILWVLQKFYKMDRADFMDDLLKVLMLKNIRVWEISKVELLMVLDRFRNSKVDFTDVYLVVMSKGGDLDVESFDKDIGRLKRLVRKV